MARAQENKRHGATVERNADGSGSQGIKHDKAIVMENRMVMIGHWSPSSVSPSLSPIFLEVPQMSKDVGAKEIHNIKTLTYHSTAVRTRGRLFKDPSVVFILN